MNISLRLVLEIFVMPDMQEMYSAAEFQSQGGGRFTFKIVLHINHFLMVLSTHLHIIEPTSRSGSH